MGEGSPPTQLGGCTASSGGTCGGSSVGPGADGGGADYTCADTCVSLASCGRTAGCWPNGCSGRGGGDSTDGTLAPLPRLLAA